MAGDRPVGVLELRSVRGTGGGPEKTILFGAARADRRFRVVVCYIRDQRDTTFQLDAKARQLGLEYVEVHERHSLDPGIFAPLVRIIRERHIDIVHAHEYKTDLVAWLLARRTGIVPLATAHGWTGNSGRERRLYYPADKWILARYPRVIAVSGEIKQNLVAHGARPERVTVILNAIDPDAFRRDPARRADVRAAWQLAPDICLVGAVGRVERQKRFDLLLEAMAPLLRERPSLRLMIVGDGSLRTEVAALADRLGVAHQCLFPGHRNDIADLHQAFDLFVQSSEYEGTPNAVLEAMAMESPLVATDVGGTGELAHDGEHGLLVPGRDVDALRRAVTTALDDPAARARWALAARRRIETELSFETRTRRLEAIYGELVHA